MPSPTEAHNDEAALRLSGVRYRYPGADEDALSGIQISIAPGERVGLLGPNGAGKSTLMRLVCGYHRVQLHEDGEGLFVHGRNATKRALSEPGLIGYLPEHVPAYPEMKVREQLHFRAAIKRIPRSQRRQEVARVCAQVGLDDVSETSIGRLSRGYRQRVGIADALLGDPSIVILDEPTIGLDPNQILEIRNVLLSLPERQTLVFSSHILQDVEAICDRILIMSRGTIVADERVSENGPSSLIVEWMGEVKGAATTVIEHSLKQHGRSLDPEQKPRVEKGRTFVLISDPPLGLAATVGKESLAQALVLTRLEMGKARLEERFARATGFDGGWAQ